jgi:hypothetical protein
MALFQFHARQEGYFEKRLQVIRAWHVLGYLWTVARLRYGNLCVEYLFNYRLF